MSHILKGVCQKGGYLYIQQDNFIWCDDIIAPFSMTQNIVSAGCGKLLRIRVNSAQAQFRLAPVPIAKGKVCLLFTNQGLLHYASERPTVDG